MKIISPTSKGLRLPDRWGSGAHGAPRGNNRKHNGVDFECVPGEPVRAPVGGKIKREARPYATGPYSGLVIDAPGAINISMFYFVPDKSLIGQTVQQGDVIGVAQDIGQRYPGITPHIHLQINSIDPVLLLENKEDKGAV